MKITIKGEAGRDGVVWASEVELPVALFDDASKARRALDRMITQGLGMEVSAPSYLPFACHGCGQIAMQDRCKTGEDAPAGWASMPGQRSKDGRWWYCEACTAATAWRGGL